MCNYDFVTSYSTVVVIRILGSWKDYVWDQYPKRMYSQLDEKYGDIFI